jgi:hypothetical protein
MRQPARFSSPAGHIIGSWANEIFARLAISPDQGRLSNICLIRSSSHTAPKTPIAMRANSNVSRIICRFPMRKRPARISRTGALPGRTISHARGRTKEEFPGSLGRYFIRDDDGAALIEYTTLIGRSPCHDHCGRDLGERAMDDLERPSLIKGHSLVRQSQSRQLSGTVGDRELGCQRSCAASDRGGAPFRIAHFRARRR